MLSNQTDKVEDFLQEITKYTKSTISGSNWRIV